MHHK